MDEPIQSGDYPRFVTSADLDSNGWRDIVIANEWSQDLTILYNSPSSFGVPDVYPLSSSPTSVQLADLSGDGIQDLLITQGNYVTIRQAWIFGGFQVEQNYNVGLAASSAAVGDSDEDGIPTWRWSKRFRQPASTRSASGPTRPRLR